MFGIVCGIMVALFLAVYLGFGIYVAVLVGFFGVVELVSDKFLGGTITKKFHKWLETAKTWEKWTIGVALQVWCVYVVGHLFEWWA